MPNQRKAGTTSILVRMSPELKARLQETVARMREAYGVSATAQEVARRAIEEKCEQLDEEIDAFLAQVKNKY